MNIDSVLRLARFKLFSIKSLVCGLVSFLSLGGSICNAQDKSSSQFSFDTSTQKLVSNTSFGGIEVSLTSQQDYQSYRSESSDSETRFRPEISLFTSKKRQPKLLKAFKQNLVKGKSNRYKNTIPAVYRLTLKGYSIMEYSDYKTDTWSLSRVKDKTIRKPEIMFSITKEFH
ncbi:MAG: hypothetical protein OQK51_06185 [Kangiellaceae bacterium]|nr:hypothetical protein [Kangiellaceae bacterium]